MSTQVALVGSGAPRLAEWPVNAADQQLVRDLLTTAGELERRGYFGTGLLHRAARRITELAVYAPAEAACPVCGSTIKQPSRGRRRRYCCDRCRWAASK